MEGTIAKDLYSGVFQSTSIEEIGSTSSQDCQNLHESEPGDSWYDDDDSPRESSVEKLKTPSDMDREWQRRHDQFHTIGYRDGLIAGKEASAQEGFNIGFKDSVSIGYNWGLARGITSALAFLPHGLKQKIVETEEARNKFQRLYESVNSLSTTDALKLFHEYQKRKPENQNEAANLFPSDGDLDNRIRDIHVLQNYYRELRSLVDESSLMDVTIINDSVETSVFAP
ncbi:hypothetical protein F511_13061 [Dorcoceras hygrometricum]|uniref:Essential protein Yae1 N-terminal domain-containing protein n=1 Tax=Dorcoceras hygrometricum TaxID=472368 RepID=A0A2Z7BB79_9LAMI|nr:hypothetical protein F511_13061 [Dorcoceras hygrometricum]